VSLYDVLSVSGGMVHHRAGAATFKVTAPPRRPSRGRPAPPSPLKPGTPDPLPPQVVFRVIAFCPFRGEIITGTLKKSTVDGVVVSLGFFDDIFVPQSCLQEPSMYESEQKVWFWDFDGQQMYMGA